MDTYRDAEKFLSLVFISHDLMHAFSRNNPNELKKAAFLVRLSNYENKTGKAMTVTELSRFSGLAVPNACRLLAPLVRDGIVERRKNGRTVSIEITPKGRQLLQERAKEMRAACAEALGVLGEEERAAFISAGEKVIGAMAEKAMKSKN